MSASCNACYIASTQPEWLARVVVTHRVDRPCEAHSESGGYAQRLATVRHDMERFELDAEPGGSRS